MTISAIVIMGIGLGVTWIGAGVCIVIAIIKKQL
nr:MetS family NSS transporter small subunit [uncultured Desulfobacter sp.]